MATAVVHERAIGLARCPACENRKASLRVSTKGLAYLVCNACNAQIFARSERSDEALRALLIAAPTPEPAPAPEPTPPQPAPEPAPTPAAPPAQPAPFSWGFLKP